MSILVSHFKIPFHAYTAHQTPSLCESLKCTMAISMDSWVLPRHPTTALFTLSPSNITVALQQQGQGADLG